jgi:hypothetical protein
MKFRLIFFLMIFELILSGCASSSRSGIAPYGRDTFNVTNSDYDYPQLRRETLDEANSHCRSIGKNFTPYSERKSSRDGGFARIFTFDMTFRCLSSDDPEYGRPVMENTPDVLIKAQ